VDGGKIDILYTSNFRLLGYIFHASCVVIDIGRQLISIPVYRQFLLYSFTHLFTITHQSVVHSALISLHPLKRAKADTIRSKRVGLAIGDN